MTYFMIKKPYTTKLIFRGICSKCNGAVTESDDFMVTNIETEDGIEDYVEHLVCPTVIEKEEITLDGEVELTELGA